ncbi:hypothetical protein SCG7109_BA_00090 [Chlamydiales bacterium SCGC AG-110-M15]|nr:hypothetical protein SCG7109_BA_00090 [Chlamydiales bacterium SCGC AG-110-M15]
MKRAIEEELWAWKDQLKRCPLIVRGARQVGKSYLIESFGKQAFESCLVINFEMHPELSSCFTSLDPEEILQKFKVYKGATIIPGKTLIFLDEIQRCPKALMALRYFKEKRPDLHVIAAGSLLEFALEEEGFSFPVGRVEFLHLRPMSFLEVLDAMNHSHLIELMKKWSLQSPPDDDLHQHCLKLIRPYLFIGGMPEIVDIYCKEQDFERCERRQAALIKTYRDDFGKYAHRARHKYLQRVLDRAPFLIGKHFQYSKVDPDFRSRDLKIAVEQLSQAGLITRIHTCAANGLPLRAEMNEKKFKILLLDVGLLQLALGNLGSEMLQSDILEIHRGALAEQFVGQELLAYSDYYMERLLHFWERAKYSSSAEVDYIVNIKGKIIPIEVKAGATGRLRSIKQLMKEKNLPLGVRISQHPLSFENGILSIPFYLIHAMPRLIDEVLQSG